MLASLLPWLADGLVILGLLVMTTSVVGLFRMPEVFLGLHVWSKVTVLGVAPLLVAAGIENQTNMLRGVLVLCFLVLTTPVSAHAVARAHWRKEQLAEAAADERGTAATQEKPSRS